MRRPLSTHFHLEEVDGMRVSLTTYFMSDTQITKFTSLNYVSSERYVSIVEFIPCAFVVSCSVGVGLYSSANCNHLWPNIRQDVIGNVSAVLHLRMPMPLSWCTT